MPFHFTTMTRNGQITIPAEIRRALSIAEGDRLLVSLEDGSVRIEPYGSVVERTAGAAYRADLPALSAEELRTAAEEAIADAALECMGR